MADYRDDKNGTDAGDLISWIVTIILLVSPVWPVGLIMLFRKLTVANMQHTLCVVCHINVMRDHHNGHTLVVERLEQLHNLRAGLTVERAGRFIG